MKKTQEQMNADYISAVNEEMEKYIKDCIKKNIDPSSENIFISSSFHSSLKFRIQLFINNLKFNFKQVIRHTIKTNDLFIVNKMGRTKRQK
jgi:hypothetical protein